MFLAPLTNLVSSMSSGGAASVFMYAFLISLVVIVVLIAAMWKVFQKAGKPGWAAIIPIYNGWVMFEVAGKPGWWALLGFIPFVGWAVLLVLEIIAVLEIAKRFGRSGAFGFFLLFLIPIGWLILGFGDAQYQGVAQNTAVGVANPPAPETSGQAGQQPPAAPGVQ